MTAHMTLDERLIIEVQQYPGLYDQTSPDYRDLRRKETMWQAVAEDIGLHVRECQARWRVLRDKFAREMRKNMNSKKAGAGALQVYQGSWALMSQLMFLTSHVKHRSTNGHLTNVIKKKTKEDMSEEEEEAEEEEEEEEEEGEEEDEDEEEEELEVEFDIAEDDKEMLQQQFKQPKLPQLPPLPQLKRMKKEGGGGIPILGTFQNHVNQQTNHRADNRNGPIGSVREWEADTDRLFCLSLVPVIKRLEPQKRSLARIHIQRLLHNLEFPQVKVEFTSS